MFEGYIGYYMPICMHIAWCLDNSYYQVYNFLLEKHNIYSITYIVYLCINIEVSCNNYYDLILWSSSCNTIKPYTIISMLVLTELDSYFSTYRQKKLVMVKGHWLHKSITLYYGKGSLAA